MGRPPLVALFFRADGYQVSWAPLDTMGTVARSAWYPASNPVARPVPDMAPLRARAQRVMGSGAQIRIPMGRTARATLCSHS